MTVQVLLPVSANSSNKGSIAGKKFWNSLVKAAGFQAEPCTFHGTGNVAVKQSNGTAGFQANSSSPNASSKLRSESCLNLSRKCSTNVSSSFRL